MAQNVLRSIRLLGRVAEAFRENCIEGIAANESRCAELIEWSLAMVTKLAPRIGYDLAADMAKKAMAGGKTIREVCEDHAVLPPDELREALDPEGMV